MELRIDRLQDTALAGFVVGLVGAVLALAPQIERLIAVVPSWPDALVMALLAGFALFGLVLAAMGRSLVGGIVAGVMGIALAVLGPVAPGILTVIGGALLFASDRAPEASDNPAQPVEDAT